ncbi:MAG: ferritin-like domain-containing protein [Myxococcales bacterium]|nr:ferritin-like domain-containing protein [Myxococcales bacterium]
MDRPRLCCESSHITPSHGFPRALESCYRLPRRLVVTPAAAIHDFPKHGREEARLSQETTFGAAPFRKLLPNARPEAPDNWSLYDRFLDLCEAHRWKMADVRSEIETVDPASLSARDLQVIDCVAEVAVVEGNAPSIVVNQLAIMLYDAEFASWATYQAGEEQKHFHCVRHYCRRVGHPMAAEHGEAKLAERQKGFDPNDFQDEFALVLINILGETLNIHLYQVLAGAADEPVLKGLLQRIARDERRHQQWFVAYFLKRAGQDPAFVPSALASLKRMLRIDSAPDRGAQQHQGTGVENYLQATEKVMRYGYSLQIITRTVDEQWRVLQECFGAALDIDRRQFVVRQMARPDKIAAQISAT